MSNNPGLQQLPMPNKQMGQLEPLSSNLGPQPLLIPGKLMEAMSNDSGSLQLLIPNRRMVSNIPGSQHFSVLSKQSVQMENICSVNWDCSNYQFPINKVYSNKANQELWEKNSECKAASTPKRPHEVPQLAEPAPANVEVASSHVPERPPETLSSNNYEYAQKYMEDQISSHQTFTSKNTEGKWTLLGIRS
ncbi:hypothetical protein NE237_028072 [Protea cynaroides]|uniref:Uncharacterized protein n=1 Tax=Protea cynaroides TaxID=273540 RepID=A0A9Q0GPK8_9MAGN|nr:hypothetical protein NE237_028072 [Protea cynaroides]